MSPTGPALNIRLQLSASAPLLLLGLALTATAAAAVLAGPLPAGVRWLLLPGVVGSGARGLWLLRHGRSAAALSAIEWQGGDRWLLWRGDGRCAAARLHPRSRRIGEAALLVFRRGAFTSFGTSWALLLPHMVSDPAALRRLRARLTLEGQVMRGLAAS